ncbi:hypothetical protein BDR06DRAFT_950903 [Suillus hirtellus]|nr:hypothetical protein BDR06DRAFT_950903 [Suillus hirtellus]
MLMVLGRLQAMTALVPVFTRPDIDPKGGPVTTPAMQLQALSFTYHACQHIKNGKSICMVFNDTTICPDPMAHT